MSVYEYLNLSCEVYNVSIYKGGDIPNVDHSLLKIDFYLRSKLSHHNYLFHRIKGYL